MRRPVSVKSVFCFSLLGDFFLLLSPSASAAILPSALFVERFFARCKLGVLNSVGAATCESTSALVFSTGAGPGLGRSHLNSAVELGCRNRNSLGHFPHRFLTIAQWFVHLSAYPQPMQQYRQLPRHSNHRSLLGIFSSSLR